MWLTQLLQMRWRAWMTRDYLRRWLSHHAFYKMELARYSAATDVNASPDNPDQRIQEDVQSFTTSTISLTMGVLNAVVTLVSFVGILWTLSGPFGFTLGGSSYTIPGYMVWAAVAYCLVGSVLAHYIGRPLIKLNFMQQRYEANLRHHLVRVREYSESIALDHGEAVERGQLDGRFTTVLANYLNLIRANKKLIWFQSFFGQAAVIFPFIVAAPRFFGGAIQLGQLIQISSAFGKVQDSLSWFVDNYDALASWRATTDRLTSFEDSMTAQTKDNEALVTAPSTALESTGLQVALPTGAVLLADVSLKANTGDHILLKGPSGSGKSTLFRAFAGIWPFSACCKRGVWLTANLCMWMNDVAAAWMMTSLTREPVWVALVQSASTLPVFLLGLPSGALADIVDRRRYFILTQFWVAAVAVAMSIVVLFDAMSAGAAAGHDLCERRRPGHALAGVRRHRAGTGAARAPARRPGLNGIAMNASRIAGPLIAGAIIASIGTVYVFLLNAVLSVAAGCVIMRWRREHAPDPLGRERLRSAMRVGLSFVRQSARVKAVLARIAVFFFHSTALLALLP
jgi:energy-coupling factor transporter ATP-binding protein EcfA2